MWGGKDDNNIVPKSWTRNLLKINRCTHKNNSEALAEVYHHV